MTTLSEFPYSAKDKLGRRVTSIATVAALRTTEQPIERNSATVSAAFLLVDGKVIHVETRGIHAPLVDRAFADGWKELIAVALNSKLPGRGNWYMDGETIIAPMGTF